MKNITYLLILTLLFSSCQDVLEDVQPVSQLTFNGFWDNENGARAAHSGLYSSVRSYAQTFWRLGEIRSDVWGGPTIESSADLDLINQNITEATAPFGNWAGFYVAVHRLNDFISNVPNIPFTDETEKSELMGQAYGLRAYIYYTMLKTWGGVPISTETFSSDDTGNVNRARSSQAEVMALIKADIESSLNEYNGNNALFNGSNVYWNRATTLALKGDVYIWSANLMGGGTADLTSAKNALQSVSGFDLESDFSNIWASENNGEYLFAFDYQVDQATNFYSLFDGRSTEISQTFDEDGNSMADYVANGGNRYGPSFETLALIDDVDDSRRNATFIRLFTDNAGYVPFDPTNYSGCILNKFRGVIQTGQRIPVSNIPVFRYADVVLLLAEAKNLLGEDPSAEINLIRQRAYGPNYVPSTHAYVNGSQSDNTNAILDERYKEFIGEGKRWWDLRRAGNSYVIDNVSTLSQGDEFKLILPLTASMLANNTELVQNPGY